jgi:hypothetical protein
MLEGPGESTREKDDSRWGKFPTLVSRHSYQRTVTTRGREDHKSPTVVGAAIYLD